MTETDVVKGILPVELLESLRDVDEEFSGIVVVDHPPFDIHFNASYEVDDGWEGVVVDEDVIVYGKSQKIDHCFLELLHSSVGIGMVQFLPPVAFDLDTQVPRQRQDLHEPVLDIHCHDGNGVRPVRALHVIDPDSEDIDVTGQFVVFEVLPNLPGSGRNEMVHSQGDSQADGDDAECDENQQAGPFQGIFTFRSGCKDFS